MRLRVTLVSLLFIAALPAAGSSAASHAGQPALCFGQAPTIVGQSGKFLMGTEGPDVVFTNGAYAADTLGGDDLMCVAGEIVEGSGDEEGFGFVAGAGNDRVDASQAGGGYFYLGPGSDEFIGSDDGFDTVYANDATAGGADADADIVSTGGGGDLVVSSGADEVHTGPSSDVLQLEGDVSAGGEYTGGAGDDNFYLDMQGTDQPHSWILNNRTGRLLRDGESVADFDGFKYFTTAARGSVTFIGSDAREWFIMGLGWLARRSKVEARMGGGNDRVNFYGGAPGGRFDGGKGTDQFYYYRIYEHLPGHTAILFDLASGLLRDTWDGGTTTRRAVHFENTKVFNWGVGYAGPVTIKGTNGPNRLKASQTPGPAATILGRGGDDQIFGSKGDDILLGGPGDDVATGRSGIDRCAAETRFNCER